MSNIISIHGYTLHRHNNDLMVEDLELARRLGYINVYNIRRLIRKMLETKQLAAETVFSSEEKTPEKGGRPGKVFFLNEKAALKVTTKSETETANKITDELIDVFIAARNGELRPRRQDETVAQFKRAEAVVRSHLSVGKMLGTEPAMAKAIAVSNASKLVGVDFSELLAGNAVEETPLTPSALGKELGLSARAMNAKLENGGFQVRLENGDWEPTDKGKPFCTMNPYKSQHSDHTGYRPLWFKRVLDALAKAA